MQKRDGLDYIYLDIQNQFFLQISNEMVVNQ